MYDNPAGLIAASIILWLLTVICVSLRFGLRLWDRQSILTSDWLILFGWTFGTGLVAMEIYGVAIKSLGHRVGATLADPTAVTGQINRTKHIQLALLLLGVTALGLIKLSVCFLYWQLFAKLSNNLALRRFLISWMVVIVAWAVTFVMAGLLECGTHLTAVFSPTGYLEHCGSAMNGGYAMVGTDIATDFVTLIIPIPIVMGLQMNLQKKLLALSAFLIGALSVGASVAKGVIYIRSSMGTYSEDGIIIITGLSIWNLVEIEVGIIAACGPLLRPAITRALSIPSFLSSKWRASSKISDHKGSDDSQHFHQMHGSEVELAMRDRRSSQAYM
ncbi:hypothetical protein PG994_014476 [Apiospora phragmitis]|uniref:Rhodopsin domain-containing protein n=1 Tax=Apiospora phragmitis TaxID=2905665 RepID=A0ABR1T4F5_9PEZI